MEDTYEISLAIPMTEMKDFVARMEKAKKVKNKWIFAVLEIMQPYFIVEKIEKA